MNRQLVRLFFVIAVGFVLLLGFTTYWQLWASSSLAARQDNLHEVVREQSIDRGRILTANGQVLAKSVPAQDRRRAAHLRPSLSPRPGLRAGHGLLVAELEPQRARAVAERLPDGLELRPLGRARARVPLDHRRRRQGQRRCHLARARGAVRGLPGPQEDGTPGCCGGLRAVDRQGGRARVLADLQPERRRARHAGLAARPALAGRRPARPRDAGPLPAWLDLQGDHGRDRARERQVHAVVDVHRSRHVPRVRAADPQRQRRALLAARSTSGSR